MINPTVLLPVVFLTEISTERMSKVEFLPASSSEKHDRALKLGWREHSA